MGQPFRVVLAMVICALAFVVTAEPAAAQNDAESDPRLPITWYTQSSAPRWIAQAFNDTSDTLVLRVVQVSDVQQLLDHMERGLVDLVFLDRALGASSTQASWQISTRGYSVMRRSVPGSGIWTWYEMSAAYSSSRSNVYLT